jgi:hypothetical protein
MMRDIESPLPVRRERVRVRVLLESEKIIEL